MSPPPTHRHRGLLVSISALTLALTLGGAPAAASPVPELGTGEAPSAPPAGVLASQTVTLVTGDRVTVDTLTDGSYGVAVDPAARPDGEPDFTATGVDGSGDLYVLPSDAGVLVPQVLDRELFNLTRLLEYGYTEQTPVIASRDGRGVAAMADRPGMAVTATLSSIDAVAATIAGDGHWWSSIRADAGPAAPAGAAAATGGKVWLDGQVRASLDESVPQIGAPQAWDAGYDGTGMTVAVLDTGIDSDHPDLVGKVVGEANFSFSEGTTDRHGHGTHVAGTVAGTGAALDGRYTGVAPGADLLNGKVLNDFGSGSNSDIIDGMEWAAANGADVISMSLGCGPGNGCRDNDGTDPMSQAVNQITAAHDVLFVIAAGNDGPGASTLGTPGVADAALTVGAVDKADQLASFSSRGPRFGDAAIKPEITAPGVAIVAARASESNRPIVDGHYTELNGTSMATPHVAGAAGLLLQQEPELTAAELKARLMSTARPPSEPSAVYQQGAGRVDVPAGLGTPVLVAPAKLELGVFEFPHDDAEPVPAAASLTNRSEEPVTLDLSVTAASQAGDPAGDAMLSVSPATLTLQPGQSAPATVTLDVRQGEIGLYGGYLTATMAGTGTVAVVPVGYHKEQEMHTLTIQGITRLGQPARGINSTLQVVNADGTSEVSESSLDFGEGTATVRVPPGVYGVTGGLSSYTGDGVSTDDFSFVSEPEVDVQGDLTVVLDARSAVPITVDTPADEESAPRRFSLGYLRRGTGGAVVSTLWLRAEWQQFYAMPTEPVTNGEFDMYTHWRIGAPRVALEPVAPAAPLDLVTYLLARSPEVNGDFQLRLVDAGFGSEADFRAVDADGAIALVTSGGGVSTVDKERNAAAAGAAAVVIAYNLSGQFPNFAVSPDATIPALSLSKENGQALRALLADGAVTLRLYGQRDTDYLYELVYAEPDRVPAELAYRAEPADLVTVQNAFHTDLTDMLLRDTRDLWRPWMASSVVFINDLLGPQARTEYLVPDGDNRHSQTAGPPVGRLREYTTRYQAVEQRDQTWVKPPAQAGVRLGSPFERSRPAYREGDQFVLQLPEWLDADNHYGNRSTVVDTTAFRLLQDGELIAEAARPRGEFPVSAQPTSYRLETDVTRTADYWLTSTETHTAWTVHSSRPAGGTPSLPLLLVDYDLPLNLTNTAPVADVPLTLRIAHQPGVTGAGPVEGVRLQISRDDGDTWQELSGTDHGDGEFGFQVPATPEDDPTGFVSIRAEAWDADGNRVEQEVRRAWRAGPAGPGCDRTVDGPHAGPLLVTSGTTCLTGRATISGPVVVTPGAGLVATSATFSGPITLIRATVVSLIGNQITGAVSLVGARTGDQPPVISGNTIDGPLSCRGNQPAPTNQGIPNQVTGPTAGQCAGL